MTDVEKLCERLYGYGTEDSMSAVALIGSLTAKLAEVKRERDNLGEVDANLMRMVMSEQDRAIAAETREAGLREALSSAQAQLAKAADQFAFYADQHAEKGTSDGDEKGMVNHQWALTCAKADHAARAALAATPEVQS